MSHLVYYYNKYDVGYVLIVGSVSMVFKYNDGGQKWTTVQLWLKVADGG